MSKVKKSTKPEHEILARNEESNRKWIEGKKKPKPPRNLFGFFPIKGPNKKDSQP